MAALFEDPILGNSALDRLATAAVIDRVVHHPVILEFEVPSYRTGVAQQRGQEQ